MREDRLDNAVAALDILARADSSAFAHGRSDAQKLPVAEARKLGKQYHASGNSRQRLMEVLRAEGAEGDAMRAGLAAYDGDPARGDANGSTHWRGTYTAKDGTTKTATVMALSADSAARLIANLPDFVSVVTPPYQRNDAAPSGCTFILVDGLVDQVIQHTGAWQSIVAREVRDLKAMDCGRVTTKEYANESVGYTKHDSVRQDATEGRYAIHYRDIRSNREMTATVTGSSMDDAESKFCRQSNVLPQYVYDVKRV